MKLSGSISFPTSYNFCSCHLPALLNFTHINISESSVRKSRNEDAGDSYLKYGNRSEEFNKMYFE